MADTKKYLDLSGLTFLVNSIKNGSIKAGKAVNDTNGSAITTTYATKAEIQALDAKQSVGEDANGHQQIITGIEQVDGKLVSLSAATLDGGDIVYIPATGEDGPLSAATTVDGALKTLAAKASAQELAAADKSVVIGTATGKTTVKVNVKTGENVLKLDTDNGLYTDIKLSAITPSSTTVKEEYALIGSDGTTQLGASIKIYKDSSLVSITLEDEDAQENPGQFLKYTYVNVSGETESVYVDVSKFLVESEFASGVTANEAGIVHGVVDSNSEKDSNDTPVAFLTVGASGFKISGIKDEIDRKINALDVNNDTAVAGQYVAAIEETDGKVAVKSRANVSDAVLTGYAKGEKPASTAIAATDDVKGAIAKIEHQIDDAKAAATTVVQEGTDNPHISVSATTESDGHKVYTITATDVASDSALTAEIAARKAVDGINASAYTKNTSANYISEATSLNNADVLLDTALKNEVDRAKSAETAIDGAVGLTKGSSDETRTWTPTTNYKASSGTHTVANNMQAIDTQVKSNQDAIALLNDDSATSGSVAYAIANAVEDTIDFITGTSADTSNQLTLNGLKTLIAEQGAASKTKVEDAVSNQKYVTVTKKTPGTGETFDTYTVGVNNIAAADAVGLNEDGTYKEFENTNYLDGSAITSIAEAVEALDTAIGASNDTSAVTTVYGAIKNGDETLWKTVLGVNNTGGESVIPTLWSLKRDIMVAMSAATDGHTVVMPKTPGNGEHITVTVENSAYTANGTTYKKVTVTESDIASANYVGTFTPLSGETTVVAHAEKYADSAVTALDNSFVRITNSEIEALFSDAPAQSQEPQTEP